MESSDQAQISASTTTPTTLTNTAISLTPAPTGGARPKKVQTSIQAFFNSPDLQMDISENRRREREETQSPPGGEPPPKRAQSDSMITNTSIGVINTPTTELINDAIESIENDEVFPIIRHVETAHDYSVEAINRNTDTLLEDAYSLNTMLPSPVPAVARNPRSPSPDLESTPIAIHRASRLPIEEAAPFAPVKPPLASIQEHQSLAAAPDNYENLVRLITANAASISSNAEQIKALVPEFGLVKQAVDENRQVLENLGATVEQLATNQQTDRANCQNIGNSSQNKINDLQSVINALQTKVDALEAQNPIFSNQLNDLHNRLPSQDQVKQIESELQFRSDKYFLSTISVKGYHRNEIRDKPPRRAATDVLATINAQSILSTVQLISVKENSIRLTFNSMVEMKRGLSIAAGCIALIRRQGANTGLKFTQLTPPRLNQQRLNLFLKAKNMKNAGNLKYWHFAVSKGDLIIQATKTDGSRFHILQNGEPMDIESPPSPRSATAECSICTSPFSSTQPISQLNCGHRFHTLCARTQMGRDIRCPSCRQKPRLFNLENLDCAACLEEPADERDENAIFIASRKCSHFHLRVCQDNHIHEIRETESQFQYTAIGTEELLNANKPGCKACKNQSTPIHSTASYLSPVDFTPHIQAFQEPREPSTRGPRRSRATNNRRARQ